MGSVSFREQSPRLGHCSACHHQLKEACVSGETALLPLPHLCNGIGPRGEVPPPVPQRGREQSNTQVLWLPGHGPADPDLQVGCHLDLSREVGWGCPQVPCSGWWDRPTVRSCPAVRGG